jgi:hypothetical protein
MNINLPTAYVAIVANKAASDVRELVQIQRLRLIGRDVSLDSDASKLRDVRALIAGISPADKPLFIRTLRFAFSIARNNAGMPIRGCDYIAMVNAFRAQDA